MEIPKIAWNLLFRVPCAIKILCVFYLLFINWYGTNVNELEDLVFILLQWVGVCWHLGRTVKLTFGKMQMNWIFLWNQIGAKNPLTDALQLWKLKEVIPPFPKMIPSMHIAHTSPEEWRALDLTLQTSEIICIVTEKINTNSCQNPQVPHEWILYSLRNFLSSYIIYV